MVMKNIAETGFKGATAQELLNGNISIQEFLSRAYDFSYHGFSIPIRKRPSAYTRRKIAENPQWHRLIVPLLLSHPRYIQRSQNPRNADVSPDLRR